MFQEPTGQSLSNLVFNVGHLAKTDLPDLLESGCWIRKPAEVPSDMNN